jgi:uncharacterized lipoprotein YajG
MNKTLTLAALAALLAGCAASPTPNYDARFGDAVRQARQQMTLNPNAGASPAPIVGMDGRAARETVIRYQDSFKSPPPVVNVINIGGSTSGGQ